MKKYTIFNRHFIFFNFLFFYSAILSSQNTGETETGIQGSWQLEEKSPTGKKRTLEMHIMYSVTYKRYFGSIVQNGDTIRMDYLLFDRPTRHLTFSIHKLTAHQYDLVVDGSSIKGFARGTNSSISISGLKTSEHFSRNVPEFGRYSPTIIPDSITDLIIEYGNKEAATVLLIIQGGPFEKIQYSTEFESWRKELHIVFVKQAQMINPGIMPPENNVQYAEAAKENLISVEILNKVIRHFKRKNKKVLVWGVSYGAWIIQKYISEFGIEADAVSIAAGRLDTDSLIREESKQHQAVVDISYKGDEIIYAKLIYAYTKPAAYLLASISEENFTKTLQEKDLVRLVVYQYGEKDGTVGRLSEPEIRFLQRKNVAIEMYKKYYHRQMLSNKVANAAIKKMLNYIDK